MSDIYDIYDAHTYRLVKPDVKLGPRSGKHKDLTPARYLKVRIGKVPEPIDYDAMVAKIHELTDRMIELEFTVDGLMEYEEE